MGRAIKAIENSQTSEFIFKNKPVGILSQLLGWEYLSQRDAVLTPYEAKIFSKKEAKHG